jgi:SanA protein
MKKLRLIVRVLSITVAIAVVIGGGFLYWIQKRSSGRFYTSINQLPPASDSSVAVVFGAGVWRDGKPSPILYDRIETACDLYKAGKVTKLLMSGDNRREDYNEPAAMREAALTLGVPDRDIVLDYAGRRTYDSCYRAKEIFGVTKPVLVTQAFHLGRAMYLCDSLGMQSVGVVADRQAYSGESKFWWSTREVVATFGALLDIWVIKPTPVLGEKLPIGSDKRPL